MFLSESVKDAGMLYINFMLQIWIEYFLRIRQLYTLMVTKSENV